VNWNKKQAAAVLEISRGTLYRKIVEYGLDADPRPPRNKTRGPG
jgi:DNA-binding NtrC family response regulator